MTSSTSDFQTPNISTAALKALCTDNMHVGG